jgi:hypothetical protein
MAILFKTAGKTASQPVAEVIGLVLLYHEGIDSSSREWGLKGQVNSNSGKCIEAPCSKLQGIFDPQGSTFILIAR